MRPFEQLPDLGRVLTARVGELAKRCACRGLQSRLAEFLERRVQIGPGARAATGGRKRIGDYIARPDCSQ